LISSYDDSSLIGEGLSTGWRSRSYLHARFGQHGCVQGEVWTYAEARAAGFSEGAIRARVRSDCWRRLWSGIYIDGASTATAALLARAALAITGEGLVAALHTAAALHGFGVLSDDLTHLAGCAGVDHAPREGLRIHVAERGIGQLDVVDGVPCTGPDRTAIDLARRLRRLDAIALLDAALRSGRCTHDSLRRELLAHRGMRGVVQARHLIPLADARAESPMESRLRLRVIDGGLPRPELQRPVFDGLHERHRLDLAWPDRLDRRRASA
jgi:hypothetical protein